MVVTGGMRGLLTLAVLLYFLHIGQVNGNKWLFCEQVYFYKLSFPLSYFAYEMQRGAFSLGLGPKFADVRSSHEASTIFRQVQFFVS